MPRRKTEGDAAPRPKGDGLDERTRAEDILLGSLGFGEGAQILSIKQLDTGYAGVGQFSDGEQFEFSSDDTLDDLERWALKILTGRNP